MGNMKRIGFIFEYLLKYIVTGRITYWYEVEHHYYMNYYFKNNLKNN